MMTSRQLVTIVSINRHSLDFCNSRQMDVVVKTAAGTLITVPWAKVPSMGTIPYKPTEFFDWLWYYRAKPGDKLCLLHGSDANYNYLEPP